MNRIELLSPAKDLETGIAAINCGADAVYIGAAQFGAREAASNALADIGSLVRYAHRYWAKIYVTLNTLLYDEELAEAEFLVRQLHETGVDALIIQDAGLLEMNLPPIPLFASTQMHNHTPERVSFLEKVGFQRAILARELTLEQIREIRARTSLELETFIHGALCVSYSGQCYMSYAIGGRSGNRGQCAQPCRRPYTLLGRDGQVVEKSRYLLSLRDLNLSQAIPELLDAGVTSFKIEGRLKDKSYVMNAVGHYRMILDQAMNQVSMRPASSGEVKFDFSPDPSKTFNRRFSTNFLFGRGAAIASPETPKSLGELVGTVKRTGRNFFLLENGAPILRPGDGICWLNSAQELTGTTIHKIEGSAIFPAKMDGLLAGTQVYRNYDQEFHEQIRKSKVERIIRLEFYLEPAGETAILLRAVDEDGTQAAVIFPPEAPGAQDIGQARLTIIKQLNKLGGSGFICQKIHIELDMLPFLPVSVLNALRRDVIGRLVAAREDHRPRLSGGAVRNSVPFPESHLAFNGNVLNHKALEFYRRHGVEDIEMAAEAGVNLTGRKVMTTRLCLRYQLNACPRQPAPQKLPEPLRLVDENGVEYPLRFNCAECVMEVYFRSPPTLIVSPGGSNVRD